MFVLRSSYNQLKNQTSELENRLAALEQQNSEKEQIIEALEAQKKSEQDSEKDTFHDALNELMLGSLDQVVGVRESVLNAYSMLQKETEGLAQFNQLFSNSSDSLTSILGSMGLMSGKMDGMNTNIKGLSDIAGRINSFVATITNISDQTNLLALNAAIEAARAGDAGRGFSVVADEVRTLANQTNTSASEVSELVSNIIRSTQDSVGSVDELKVNNDSLSDGIEQLNSQYHSIIDCCDSMKSTINHSSMRSFVQTVKLDHIVWKSDVYAVLFGKSHKLINDFSDHTSCRLGQWYRAEGQTLFGNDDAFRNLERPHKDVHTHGVQAIQKAQEGLFQSALEELQKMEKASENVMYYLDNLKI